MERRWLSINGLVFLLVERNEEIKTTTKFSFKPFSFHSFWFFFIFPGRFLLFRYIYSREKKIAKPEAVKTATQQRNGETSKWTHEYRSNWNANNPALVKTDLSSWAICFASVFLKSNDVANENTNAKRVKRSNRASVCRHCQSQCCIARRWAFVGGRQYERAVERRRRNENNRKKQF